MLGVTLLSTVPIAARCFLSRAFAILTAVVGASAWAQSWDVDAGLGWSGLDTGGNQTRFYQYRTLPEGWYVPRVGVTTTEPGYRFTSGWLTPGEDDHLGALRLVGSKLGHSVRASWDRFRYFADPAVLFGNASQSESRRVAVHLEGGPHGIALDLRVADMWVSQPDIIRLRPGSGYEYRSMTYEAAAAVPIRGGSLRADFRAVGLDDATARAPTGWTRELALSGERDLGEALQARLYYRDQRTDQGGHPSASARQWGGGATWTPRPDLRLRVDSRLSRVALPMTVSRHASNRDRVTTEVTWRPSRGTSVTGTYEYKAWLLEQDGMPFSESTASHLARLVGRRSDPSLGLLQLHYEQGYLLDPPITTIATLVSSASLYADRWQRLSGTWTRDLGSASSAHAEARWTERHLTARDLALRTLWLGAGLSIAPNETIHASLDYCWESHDLSLWDSDPYDLNDGNSGDLGSGLASRPYSSRAGTLTGALSWQASEHTSLSASVSLRNGYGGERGTYLGYGIELRHSLGSRLTLACSYLREEFTDDFVSLYDYDANVLRLSLRATFP